MATLAIHSIKDVSKTRNTMRKLLLAQRCMPILVARSAAAVGILTEALLPLGITLYVDVGTVWRGELKMVEMTCEMLVDKTATARINDAQTLLKYAANEVHMIHQNERLNIHMCLW